MSWRTLIEAANTESKTFPWTGEGVLRTDDRTWHIKSRHPREFGWYSFALQGRNAKLEKKAQPNLDLLGHRLTGYLVGNRFVPDTARVSILPAQIAAQTEPVYLIEEGLDKFVRVSVGRTGENEPLIFVSQEFPLGPEDEVVRAFEDGLTSIDHIPHIPPALDAAFRMEVFQKEETERRRKEAERIAQEEEARRIMEERREALIRQTGSAVARRELAQVDFDEAARGALRISGAEFLSSRKTHQKNERAVRFRLDRRRFECTVDVRNLAVIDSGICLVDHATGRKGDQLLTLESLPGVYQEAIRTHRLVVYRHVD